MRTIIIILKVNNITLCLSLHIKAQKNISLWEDGFVMTTDDILIKLNNCYYDK